jgi:hypothetical protein
MHWCTCALSTGVVMCVHARALVLVHGTVRRHASHACMYAGMCGHAFEVLVHQSLLTALSCAYLGLSFSMMHHCTHHVLVFIFRIHRPIAAACKNKHLHAHVPSPSNINCRGELMFECAHGYKRHIHIRPLQKPQCMPRVSSQTTNVRAQRCMTETGTSAPLWPMLLAERSKCCTRQSLHINASATREAPASPSSLWRRSSRCSVVLVRRSCARDAAEAAVTALAERSSRLTDLLPACVCVYVCMCVCVWYMDESSYLCSMRMLREFPYSCVHLRRSPASGPAVV